MLIYVHPLKESAVRGLFLYILNGTMKKILFILLLGVEILACFSTIAQKPVSLFQPLGWEQASLIAARENKLVLVAAGKIEEGVVRGVKKHAELMNFLNRHLVALSMDMSTVQGQQFEPRLLMYPYPVFAFFMPYGELLGVVSPESVRQHPEALREALEKALETAKIKKANSRSVSFAELTLSQALEEAVKTDKPVFVWLTEEKVQACLLMERNVFNLDKVADFYNRNFINIRPDASQSRELCRRYNLAGCPAFLFLDTRGKVLYQGQGYSNEEQLIDYGERALEQAKGIPFQEISPEKAAQLAREQGKPIFTDYYVVGSAHKEMARNLFTDPDVTNFFKEHFINVSREADQPALVFSDAEGQELHRVVRVNDAEALLQEARKVISGTGLAGMQLQYQQGQRQAEFLEEYIRMLDRAGLQERASGVLMVYFERLSPEKLKEARYWNLLERYGLNLSAEYFDYVLSHRNELYVLYGEEKVRKKIAALWVAGAENFVKDGEFDEAGFKAYAKRLKKEKVEGARLIIRNARMHAAEKVGDWKVYITLAEEKWNEEKIPDSELYSWGVKINEHCSDEGLRYKMAQWLARRAMELGRKEQISGKVKVSSYRGFFEKLVNDLLKK